MVDRGGRRQSDFSAETDEDFDSPHQLFAHLRSHCPVAWSNDLGGFWAVTRHSDAKTVLEDWQTYTTRIQNVVPPVATTQRRPPLHLDPPDNIPYRNAILRFLTPQRMENWEKRIGPLVAHYLDPFLAKGGGDICAEFSFLLPIALLAEFFNLPPDHAERIRLVGAEFNMALQRQDFETLREKSDALYAIAQALIDDRKANPRDADEDPTASLLAVRIEGKPLDEALVLGALRQFLLVGIIAPTTFIGSMAVHLARHKKHHCELAREPEKAGTALEELLRLYTPYRGFARTATRDTELGGRQIREGDPVAIVFTAANRDASVFEEPDTYRLDRPSRDLLTFGRGPHMCPGAPLARLLLREVLRQLCTKTSALDIVGDIEMTRWPEYGPLAVPLRVVMSD